MDPLAPNAAELVAADPRYPRGTEGHHRALGEAGELPKQSLKKIPQMFFDIDALLFGLEAFKATRGLDRLHADRVAIRSLLESDHWYTLHATEADMRLDRYENRQQWQRMAQQLINAYAERFYRFVRGRWEAPYLEVGEVDADDPSMIDSYTIETTDLVQSADDIERIAGLVNDLKAALNSDSLAAWSTKHWRATPFPGHLYQPLLYAGKGAEIRISPVALDKWEAAFVDDLAKWCREHGDGLDVYLLRNQAVTGLGFFQASNFFPTSCFGSIAMEENISHSWIPRVFTISTWVTRRCSLLAWRSQGFRTSSRDSATTSHSMHLFSLTRRSRAWGGPTAGAR